MELLQLRPSQKNGMIPTDEPPFDLPYITIDDGMDWLSNAKPFIEANTIQSTLSEIKHNHIIPSFAKDGEPLISHADFIDAAMQITSEIFLGETILRPNIRLSHEIRGRVPSAKNKPAKDLQDNEKTLFYERMAFVIEIPTIKGLIENNSLSLVVGGVKSYAADNLNNRKGAEQHFKLFIGFKNTVCTNSCISTDGLLSNISVTNIGQLNIFICSLLKSFNLNHFLKTMGSLADCSMTEKQFCKYDWQMQNVQLYAKADASRNTTNAVW